MAGEWRTSTWGDEISLEYGKALRGHETASGRYRVFGSNGPIGWTDQALAPGPGVVLGRKGAYRGVEYSHDPFFVIDTAYYVVPKTDIDMRWLYHAIKHHKLGEVDDGSPIPSTTRAAVYVLDLDVPPREEQRAIAHILGTLDDKIELNRRMSETLEAMARALFKSWFIDFDPVRRNAARDRNEPSPRSPLPTGEGRTGEGRTGEGRTGEGRTGEGRRGEGAKHGGEGHYRGGYDFAGLVERARELRRKHTPAEQLFWELVRARRLLDLKFRRQHQLGDYIADYYCHEHRLVIELDGGIHSIKQKKDHRRDAWMAAQGFTVLRFPNEQVLDDPSAVLCAIADAVYPPLPLGEGRGKGSVEGLASPPSPVGGGVGGKGSVEGLASPPSPVGRGVGGEGVIESIAFDHLFPARLVDSELGKIPEGWEVGTLGDHFDAVKGVSYKGSGLGDSGLPLHNLNSVYEGGGYKYEGIKYYAGEYAERHIIRPGDVIVANTEQGHDRLLIGYAAIVPGFFGSRGIASHHIYRLRPKPPIRLTAGFLCHLLNSPQMHDVVSGYANGTTVNMLPIDGLQKPKILCPPQPLVTAFDSLASEAEQRREEMVSESRTLAGLRGALLPKLISGELRVEDAYRFVAEAAS